MARVNVCTCPFAIQKHTITISVRAQICRERPQVRHPSTMGVVHCSKKAEAKMRHSHMTQRGPPSTINAILRTPRMRVWSLLAHLTPDGVPHKSVLAEQTVTTTRRTPDSYPCYTLRSLLQVVDKMEASSHRTRADVPDGCKTKHIQVRERRRCKELLRPHAIEQVQRAEQLCIHDLASSEDLCKLLPDAVQIKRLRPSQACSGKYSVLHNICPRSRCERERGLTPRLLCLLFSGPKQFPSPSDRTIRRGPPGHRPSLTTMPFYLFSSVCALTIVFLGTA
jgi:hypothetical protein